MISDKQTLQDGRIVDLNRKLQEATSRCRRLKHTRNESKKRLLYALVENERLRFLLKTQASTITTLKSDFSIIENLTHQQIDLLPDRNTRSPLSNAARHSTSATRGEEHDNKASTNPISSAIIDNHHCNYRHPSGSAAIPSSSPSSSPSCTRLTSTVTSDDDCYLGPVKRTILIDSDCELSQSEPERRPGTDNDGGDEGNQKNHSNGTDCQVPYLGPKNRSSLSAKGMTMAVCPGTKSNDKRDFSRPINDCASPDSQLNQKQHHQQGEERKVNVAVANESASGPRQTEEFSIDFGK
ncbi:hypothetical protein RP20_CCG000011 [Aedes albopictus]|nr:hypothetical protein RP20_CCG000011 [Aedes albopictus]